MKSSIADEQKQRIELSHRVESLEGKVNGLLTRENDRKPEEKTEKETIKKFAKIVKLSKVPGF